MQVILGEDGLLSQLVLASELETCGCIINCYVRKLVHQNWLSVQDYEHDIHFQDAIQPVSKFVYIAPAVEEYWKDIKDDSWNEKDIILSSDGRNDSPGHCAQYLTYSFADMETKTILDLKIVDVREVDGRKSTKIKRVGFERGVDDLLTSKMNLQEIVTNGHLEISALMSMFMYILCIIFIAICSLQ